MARIFYARVSTEEQNETRQITAARAQGITDDDNIFVDKLSGKDMNRPRLKAMLGYIRKGDTIVVESISRLARSTRDLLTLVEQITGKGAEFISLKESIDTTTPQGRFMLTVFAAMAELEREQIKQRQAEGIAEAKKEDAELRAQGKTPIHYKGRHAIQIDEARFIKEVKKWREGKQTAVDTMKKLGLKANTFYRRVKQLDL